MGALQTQMDKKYHKYTELKEKKRKGNYTAFQSSK